VPLTVAEEDELAVLADRAEAYYRRQVLDELAREAQDLGLGYRQLPMKHDITLLDTSKCIPRRDFMCQRTGPSGRARPTADPFSERHNEIMES
jgi:hypothetical protein